jgi:hypothetical protein
MAGLHRYGLTWDRFTLVPDTSSSASDAAS